MRVCESGGSASISPSLIGFKPRQVLLAQKTNSIIPMGKNRSTVARLNSEQESILTCSVAMWLDTKGFSKVLKRFISSALIKDQDWKAKGIDLNEVFSKHLANSNGQESILTCSVALWLETKGFSKALKRFISSAQIKDQDWKAKAIDLNEVFSKHLANSNDVQENESLQEKRESVVVDSSQINGEVSGEKAESKKKKKKNKNKREDAPVENVEVPNAVEKVKKSKTDGKKEKKNKTTDVGDSKVKSELTEKVPDSAVEKKASKKRSIDATEGDEESKKASKKRKRMAVDETEDKPNEEAVQELKAKNSKGAKEGKDVNTQNKEETVAKDIAVGSKDEVKNEVEKFSNSKSGRKQNGNYSEPKTVNAFQRVKVDEVIFADERLQDNSYWAKDGADIGYGAKAQEVLGQVRGRNFRHEKTKKKRGSYRGGIIDLQSHSIKFDNSDDE